MTEIKPPAPIPAEGRFLFLAGSIELNTAEEWQKRAVELLKDTSYIILNPRRDAWDNAWQQTMGDANFRGQVEWELEGLEKSDTILFYFDPATKSPVSLLELGLHARKKNVLVVCPEGFWRKGNVDITCARYGIEQAATLEEACIRLRGL